jgi:hypothetical protein
MLDNPTSPQDMLYLPADLFGRIQDGKNLMKKEAIDDRLGELKSKCKVKHIPYKGYQHIKYGGLESDFNE